VDEPKDRLDASDEGEPAAIEESAGSGADTPRARDDGPSTEAVAVEPKR
jgi:hypothetical protein